MHALRLEAVLKERADGGHERCAACEENRVYIPKFQTSLSDGTLHRLRELCEIRRDPGLEIAPRYLAFDHNAFPIEAEGHRYRHPTKRLSHR